MNKIFCVISHTHWDREWYMPFEKFRFRLTDLIDNLLDILEENPEYIFHMDAQTIVLEDYLEIKPHKRDLLMKHIRDGRMLIGPWYVQNDFYLTSGEATIRNLLIGSSIAEEMGKCSWVGYTPDQFGLISQLPQIFNGFGIDNCIFGRGYSFFRKQQEALEWIPMPSEFIWKGEDGSKVLAIHMPFWYNNAQRFSEDIDKSMKLVDLIERQFNGIALTPYLLLMNGVDHLEAQENLMPILDKINERMTEGKVICQYSMQQYADNVREYLETNNITVNSYTGEQRNGVDNQVLQGTLSSRVYLKALNVKAQNLLECKLEPLYSFIQMEGADGFYPADYMKYVWKLLIQNHPHDSICGCSRDAVHSHMEDRFSRISETGDELLVRGMDFISTHVNKEGLTDKDYLVCIFNTVEDTRGGVVDIELEFPVVENVEGFALSDMKGNAVPYIVTKKQKKYKNIFSPINLPGVMDVDSYMIKIPVENMAGLSYRVLVVKPSYDKAVVNVNSNDSDRCVLENEYLKAVIQRDGKVDLLNKETGKVYTDILKLEESEDWGDSYVYRRSPEGKTYLSSEMIPEIKCVENNIYARRFSLIFNWELPEYYDRARGVRSGSKVTNRVEVELGLKKCSRYIDVNFKIDSKSKDHRIRALVSTGCSSDISFAATPFDVIARDRREVLKGIQSGTQPNSGFVCVEQDNEGIAVLNEGLYEYEHLLGDEGSIAITLVRGNDLIEISSMGETWKAPENQCIRSIEVRMGILAYNGGFVHARIPQAEKDFNNGLLGYFKPVDYKKFIGGRPAVQDSEIKEFFYRPIPYGNILMPGERKYIDIKGEGVVLSALKKSEKDNRTIIRLYNTTSEKRACSLNFFKTVLSACKVNMKEDKLCELQFADNEIDNIELKPKEILTVAVEF